jgi:hypothetical protein
MVVDLETLNAKKLKVQALLNLADDERTPEHEAASARERAEKMMHEYRIDESELAEARPDLAIKPVRSEFTICLQNSQYLETYWQVFCDVSRHVGVRHHNDWRRDPETGQHLLVGVVVGYQSDVWYAENLYTAARHTFASRMEPQYDPKLTDAENIYNLRSAGITRQRVAAMVWGSPNTKNNPDHGKVGRIYRAECERRGEDPAVMGKGNTAANFRLAYSKTFAGTMWSRLRSAKLGVDVDSGGALVLANRKDKVDEAFYDYFPHLRPSNSTEVATAELTEKEKKAAERDRVRRLREWQKKYEKEQRAMASAGGRVGQAAGEHAAYQVDLDTPEPTRRAPDASRTPLEG